MTNNVPIKQSKQLNDHFRYAKFELNDQIPQNRKIRQHSYGEEALNIPAEYKEELIRIAQERGSVGLHVWLMSNRPGTIN